MLRGFISGACRLVFAGFFLTGCSRFSSGPSQTYPLLKTSGIFGGDPVESQDMIAKSTVYLVRYQIDSGVESDFT